MDIFFYATSRLDTGKRYLESLRKCLELKNMTILSGESLFLSPLALKLRSGDLIILLAANTDDLNELVTLRNDFNSFRLILILADSDSETIHKALLLQPSFITFLEEETVSLTAVVRKMIRSDMLLAQKPTG